jgi:RNase H-like domain found in reverse transcriptase
LQNQNHKWKLVAFLSKALNEMEWNYEIYNKELLAIMITFSEWWQYLIGAKEAEVFTDHQNLICFRRPQKLNRWQVRWVIELTQFNFMLKHRPRCLNSKADLLSQCADHNMGHNDNPNMTVLKESWFWAIDVAWLGTQGGTKQRNW